MKLKLAVILIAVVLFSATHQQYLFAEEKIKQQDWSVAEKLFETKCKLCHSLDRPKKARKTPEEWKSAVTRMKSYAPVMTDEEAKLITDYLSHHYGRQ